MTPYDDALRAWQAVPRLAPGQLTDARLQAHWAAQLVRAVAEKLVPARRDGAHLAMTWLDPLEVLAGAFTPGGLRVGLRVRDLCLAVLDADDRLEWSLELDGRTLEEARGWLREVLASEGEVPGELQPRRDDLPSHPVASGNPFRRDEPGRLATLATWYGNVARLLAVLSTHTLGASPVRCWPHRLDLACQVHLEANPEDPAPDGSTAEAPPEDVPGPAGAPAEGAGRSLTAGFSPGDEYYDQPYVYVAPWPEPGRVEGEPLEGGGHWHARGFTAAVLPAQRLPDSGPEDPDGHAQEQAEQVYRFLRSGMAAGRGLLGAL